MGDQLLDLPSTGSPEFMVLWTALQQFYDNSVEIIEEDGTCPGQPHLPAMVKTAQVLIERFDRAMSKAASLDPARFAGRK